MTFVRSDLLGAEAFSPLAGSPLVFLAPGDALPAGGVTVLVDREGQLPAADPAVYDVLVTTCAGAPPPWVSLAPERIEAQLNAVRETAELAPVATAMLAKLLRIGENLEFDAALELESLAYSALLGGGEFARWLAGANEHAAGKQATEPVRYQREDNLVTLTLASPGNHNAMTASMRDALFEALVNVLEDPSEPRLMMKGAGKCFSTGGSLAEFGTARDLAQAHIIRTQHSCARILHRLGDRAEVRLHGACIGSGIEVPLAAGRRVASADLMVQLPELRMGLIPGAGGTVTLSRAVGRHRLFWLTLGGFRIGANQALDWGLVHASEP
jgi:enoyl-CoA hydratase/carnithine racemase